VRRQIRSQRDYLPVSMMSMTSMTSMFVEIRGHMGHIDILVVAVVRRLSRRWKVKTLPAGPSPTSPMKAEITISPISNNVTTDILKGEALKALLRTISIRKDEFVLFD